MSVQAISWVLDNSQAKYADRLVLFSIANHCDKFGREAWPKHETIAEEAGVCKREVIRAIQSLTALGELTVVKGGGKKGKGRHEYILPKMEGAKKSPTEISTKVTSDPILGDKCSTPPTPPNKEEPSLTVRFNLTPPSSGRDGKEKPKKQQKTTDPRYQPCVESLSKGYKRRGWQFGFGKADGEQLNQLLRTWREMTVEDFRRWVTNYFKSEKVVQGGLPRQYLAKLPQYHEGPLDQYGKLLDCAPAGVEL